MQTWGILGIKTFQQKKNKEIDTFQAVSLLLWSQVLQKRGGWKGLTDATAGSSQRRKPEKEKIYFRSKIKELAAWNIGLIWRRIYDFEEQSKLLKIHYVTLSQQGITFKDTEEEM